MKLTVVSTQYGPVQGINCKTEKDVLVFKGIPIGADTSGNNRFRPPQPPVPWDEVRLCDTWPDRFLQHTAEREPGTFWGDEFFYDPAHDPGNSENGLAVNVFVPEDTGSTPLPVYVFFHGGGFTGGYASEVEFYAERLAAQGVILVFAQYRLGALGWLTLPEFAAENPSGVSGNWAVLDALHALEWVKNNIAAFGGDPQRVTIGGQSAGAMMVTHLLRSPLARPYFKRAIVQSGFNGFLSPSGGTGLKWRNPAEAQISLKKELTELFGREVTADDLRSIPTSDWFLPGPRPKYAEDGTPLSILQQLTRAAGTAVLDRYVFTETSVDLLHPGNLAGVDILLGGTADEATTMIGDRIEQMGITAQTAPGMLEEAYGKGCAAIYPTSTDTLAQASFMRARSDACLQKYILTAALSQKESDHRTFVYYLRQVPPSRRSDFFGAYHACDLWYTFDSIRDGAAGRSWTEEDLRMAEITSTYFMNFVKTGDPTGSGITPRSGYPLAAWKPCDDASGLAFMDLGDGTSRLVCTTDHPERDTHHRQYIKSLL